MESDAGDFSQKYEYQAGKALRSSLAAPFPWFGKCIFHANSPVCFHVSAALHAGSPTKGQPPLLQFPGGHHHLNDAHPELADLCLTYLSLI